MPINTVTTQPRSAACHPETVFQCQEGFGQLIKDMQNTANTPEWLQFLRENRVVTLATKYEHYHLEFDENNDIAVRPERRAIGNFIQRMWYEFTHCSALGTRLFGHTALDMRARDMKIQTEKKYYRAVWNEWENNAPPGSNEQRGEAVRKLQEYLQNIHASPECNARRLRLNGFNLSSLPELPQGVISLYVDNNQLQELPVLPGSLRMLFANNNQLRKLPALPNSLQILNVYHNQLEELSVLPESLGTLSAHNNQLRKLPVLPVSLKILMVHDNQLQELPALPESLGTLIAYNNQLTQAPESLPSLLHNATVDISGNPLSKRPQTDALAQIMLRVERALQRV